MTRDEAIHRYQHDAKFRDLVTALELHLSRNEFTVEEYLGAIALVEYRHSLAGAKVTPIRQV